MWGLADGNKLSEGVYVPIPEKAQNMQSDDAFDIFMFFHPLKICGFVFFRLSIMSYF
jgi:hypothetical protein